MMSPTHAPPERNPPRDTTLVEEGLAHGDDVSPALPRTGALAPAVPLRGALARGVGRPAVCGSAAFASAGTSELPGWR